MQAPEIKPSWWYASIRGGSRSGRSVLEFPVKVAGQYDLSCNYPEDTKGPQTVLAVGSGVGEKIIQTILRSLVSMFGGVGLGVPIIILVSVKRRAAKKRLAAYANPSQ